MLTPTELSELDKRISFRADELIAARTERCKVAPKVAGVGEGSTRTRGRPPKSIENPFYQFIGPTSSYGRYPEFALDVIEGVARLDWHDRPIGSGGKSVSLSVRKLAVILESLEKVTAEAVGHILLLAERHSQRYVKAIGIIIPYMLKARPKLLTDEMEGRFD